MSSDAKSSKIKKVLHYPIVLGKQLRRLPSTAQKTDDLHKDLVELSYHHSTTKKEAQSLKQELTATREELEKSKHRLQQMDERLTDAIHQLALMSESKSQVQPKNSTLSSKVVADNHMLDNFYVQFEKWFRGSSAEIKKNQAVYLPYFTDSAIRSQDLPVIDIGCGSGEFVELITEANLKAIGLDLNIAMVNQVKSKGIEAVQSDALSYLRDQKTGSAMAITGFHIAEHIPFVDLMSVFSECYRVLAPGGFVIFETPNPENTIVGSCNFYNDPTHLHPLPPAFLELAIKSHGFHDVEIKRLHPIKDNIDHQDALVKEMAQRFYGPQDYSVIAYK